MTRSSTRSSSIRFEDGDWNNNFNVDYRKEAAYHGGDWQGIIDRLDYIEALGVTALWISPVVRNVENDAGFASYHGYWTQDFTRVNLHFGDLTKLQELVRACHARGLKVILDVVTNHVGQLFYYDINRNGQPDIVFFGGGGAPLGSQVDNAGNQNSDLRRVSVNGTLSLTIEGYRASPPSVKTAQLPSFGWKIQITIERPLAQSNSERTISTTERVERPSGKTSANVLKSAKTERNFAATGAEEAKSEPVIANEDGLFWCGSGPVNPYRNTCMRECWNYLRQQEMEGDFPGGLKDLNTRRPDVRDALINVFQYWIDVADFDGFRIDTLKHVEHEFYDRFAPAMRAHAKKLGKKELLHVRGSLLRQRLSFWVAILMVKGSIRSSTFRPSTPSSTAFSADKRNQVCSDICTVNVRN